MFCCYCGEEIYANANFCGSCGKRIQGTGLIGNNCRKVILCNAGRNKISVIKEIRALLGVGLAEAKEICDQVPSLLKDNISITEAERIEKVLKSVGADIRIE